MHKIYRAQPLSHTHLQHEDVPVIHDLLRVVELVVDDLVDDGVAIPLPHSSHHLTRQNHGTGAVLHQEQVPTAVLNTVVVHRT